MNARQILPVVGVLAVFPAIYFLFPRANADDSIDPNKSWAPTPADIQAAVKSGPASGIDDPRLAAFCALFKQRYRDHQRAVGVKFISDSEIKAMFEPNIARWEMSEIAGQADTESSRIFGRHFKIGIYETYITAIRKVGVLEFDPVTKKQVFRFGPEYAADDSNRSTDERSQIQDAIRYVSELFPAWNTNPDPPASLPEAMSAPGLPTAQ